MPRKYSFPKYSLTHIATDVQRIPLLRHECLRPTPAAPDGLFECQVHRECPEILRVKTAQSVPLGTPLVRGRFSRVTLGTPLVQLRTVYTLILAEYSDIVISLQCCAFLCNLFINCITNKILRTASAFRIGPEIIISV